MNTERIETLAEIDEILYDMSNSQLIITKNILTVLLMEAFVENISFIENISQSL